MPRTLAILAILLLLGTGSGALAQAGKEDPVAKGIAAFQHGQLEMAAALFTRALEGELTDTAWAGAAPAESSMTETPAAAQRPVSQLETLQQLGAS